MAPLSLSLSAFLPLPCMLSPFLPLFLSLLSSSLARSSACHLLVPCLARKSFRPVPVPAVSPLPPSMNNQKGASSAADRRLIAAATRRMPCTQPAINECIFVREFFAMVFAPLRALEFYSDLYGTEDHVRIILSRGFGKKHNEKHGTILRAEVTLSFHLVIC